MPAKPAPHTPSPLPVAVDCLDQVPPRPALSAERVWKETDDVYQRFLALRSDRRVLLAHVIGIEKALAKCITP
jgi:hypothetical protein